MPTIVFDDSAKFSLLRTTIANIAKFAIAAIGKSVTPRSWMFLILYGLATGASWLCYFYAIKIGDVSKVIPIDKCSLVLTIIFAVIFLGV